MMKKTNPFWFLGFLAFILVSMVVVQGNWTIKTFKAAVGETTFYYKLTKEEKEQVLSYNTAFYDITFKKNNFDTMTHARLRINSRYLKGVDSVVVSKRSYGYIIVDVVN